MAIKKRIRQQPKMAPAEEGAMLLKSTLSPLEIMLVRG